MLHRRGRTRRAGPHRAWVGASRGRQSRTRRRPAQQGRRWPGLPAIGSAWQQRFSAAADRRSWTGRAQQRRIHIDRTAKGLMDYSTVFLTSPHHKMDGPAGRPTSVHGPAAVGPVARLGAKSGGRRSEVKPAPARRRAESEMGTFSKILIE